MTGQPPAERAVQSAIASHSLITAAVRRFTEHAGTALDAANADRPALIEAFAGDLGRQLAKLTARTAAHELRIDGQRLAEPERLARLLVAYPVLTRMLGDAALAAADALAELLIRFAADRPAVVTSLFGSIDPGRLVAIETRKGDPHRRGRSVSVLVFAGGGRVVYRPRDVTIYQRFADLVDWMNGAVPDLGLRTVAVVAREGYGWLEYVTAEQLSDLSGASRFYRRQGALLALLHAVRAVDLHYQNLIARGDQPVVIDVETLFHPNLTSEGDPDDPAARAIAGSVYRIGLLPRIEVGADGPTDTSGLGAGSAGGHRPRFDDHELDPGDHLGPLLDGFRRGYNAIMRTREAFTTLIGRCADLEVRLVVRPTRLYAALLDDATRPELLGDPTDRRQVFEMLRTFSACDPLRSRLWRREVADLCRGDIPLFTGRPGSRDVWTADGLRLPDLLERTGLDHATSTVAAMSVSDRSDQEWVIAAAMATRRPFGGHDDLTPMAGPVTSSATYPERLLTAACAVADRIESRGLQSRGRVNWCGLELVDDRQWLALPMGAGLANGYTGVALFLAQLGALTGITRYTRLARHAVAGIPRLLDTLAAQPVLATAVGPGGLAGLGGIAYALTRLSTLLADAEVRDWANTAVDLTRTTVTDRPGWSTGIAGCLAAMTAVHRELGLAAAARLAGACAERLTALTHDDAMPAGFADGAAGVVWALHGRTTRPATLFRFDATRRPGWCSGTAGLLLAKAVLAGPAENLERGWRDLAARPLLADLSLCHGELGIADVMIALAAPATVRRHHAGVVLDAIDRCGPLCGTPDRVPTPGLLNGLAGIGYGLLRIGFPDRVPSVLLLEPTPVPNREQSRPTKRRNHV